MIKLIRLLSANVHIFTCQIYPVINSAGSKIHQALRKRRHFSPLSGDSDLIYLGRSQITLNIIIFVFMSFLAWITFAFFSPRYQEDKVILIVIKSWTRVVLSSSLQWRKILLETVSAVLRDLSWYPGTREIIVTSQVEPFIPGVRNGAGFTGNKNSFVPDSFK